jgi:hypothetical protein
MVDTGGLALEEVVRRQPTPPPPAFAALDEPLRADFRTPGPSGLEVAEHWPVAPALPMAPPPPLPARLEPAVSTSATSASASAVPVATRGETPAREKVEPPERPRHLASLLLNSLSLALLLAVAAALYAVWVSDGHPIRDLAKILGARPQASFTMQEVSSGLYDTARGKPVFFVRGQLVARAALAGPVRVRVDLVDGDRAVARGDGVAGAPPTPEEVWSLTGPVEAERLRTALAARPQGDMAPGEARPFLVVLWDYPADLRGLDVRVSALPGPR